MEVLRIGEFAGLHTGLEPGDVPLGGLWCAVNLDVGDPRMLRMLPQHDDLRGSHVLGSAVRDAVMLDGDVVVLRVGNPMVADVLNGNTGATVSLGNTLAAGSEASLCEWRSPTERLVWLLSSQQAPEQWDTATNAWTAPTATVDGVAGRAMPKLDGAVQSAIDQRLLGWTRSSGLDGPHAAQSYPWRIWVSEPGLPKTWTTTRYFDLFPAEGDALGVIGAVSWGGKVFFFTPTTCFVLHSVSTTGGGVPVFNIYDIPGAGMGYRRLCCGGTQGVYFANERGLWRTTGGAPELVSAALGTMFAGGSHPYGLVGLSGIDTMRSLRGHNGRLYMPLGSQNNEALMQTLVYDEGSGLFSAISEVGIVLAGDDSATQPIATPHEDTATQTLRVWDGGVVDGEDYVLTLPFEPAGGEWVTVRRVVIEAALVSGSLPTVKLAGSDQLRGDADLYAEQLVHVDGDPLSSVGEMPVRLTYQARTRGRAFALRLNGTNDLRNLGSIEVHFEPAEPRLAQRATYD